MKSILTLLIFIFNYNLLTSQNLSFEFLKECPKYTNHQLSDKLNEIGFSLLNNNFENIICQKNYQTGQYFTNNINRDFSGEIGLIINKKEDNFVIEINYTSYYDNWEIIGTKINEHFELEKTFYSARYKCKVNKYSYNNIFYYAFIDQQVEDLNYPAFIVTNIRIDECYFSY